MARTSKQHRTSRDATTTESEVHLITVRTGTDGARPATRQADLWAALDAVSRLAVASNVASPPHHPE